MDYVDLVQLHVLSTCANNLVQLWTKCVWSVALSKTVDQVAAYAHCVRRRATTAKADNKFISAKKIGLGNLIF